MENIPLLPARRFTLYRHRDESGVSGTGTVADGVMFPSGTTVIEWRGQLTSVAVYPDADTLIAVHGHGGATELRWLDSHPTVAERNT